MMTALFAKRSHVPWLVAAFSLLLAGGLALMLSAA